jgi:hypothetical protein
LAVERRLWIAWESGKQRNRRGSVMSWRLPCSDEEEVVAWEEEVEVERRH